MRATLHHMAASDMFLSVAPRTRLVRRLSLMLMSLTMLGFLSPGETQSAGIVEVMAQRRPMPGPKQPWRPTRIPWLNPPLIVVPTPLPSQKPTPEQQHAEYRAQVRKLPETDRRSLADFARRKGHGVDTESLAQLYPSWFARMRQDDESLKAHLAASRVTGRTAGEIQTSLDAHDARYRDEAHRRFIQSDLTLSRLDLSGWRFDASSTGDIGAILSHLHKPIPGHQPELVFVLDPGDPLHQYAAGKMTDAFQQPGRNRPDYLQHDDTDRLMAGYAGRSLIVVGHIEGSQFVLRRETGRDIRISIGDLMTKAEQHGVLLVPIGCKSREANAAFGYMKNIDDAQVSDFLRAIPAQNATIGDLFAAAGKIGPIEANGRSMAGHLQGVVRPPAQAGVAGEDVVTIISASFGTALDSQPAAAYEAFIEQESNAVRPLYDRGPLRSWGESYRRSPWNTLTLSAITCVVIAAVVGALQRKFDRPTRSRRALWDGSRLSFQTIAAAFVVWSSALLLIDDSWVLALIQTGLLGIVLYVLWGERLRRVIA